MISIGLQVAYLQVPVHQESRRYLHFCIDERTFQFRVLCFGLSSAPQVFTRVMAPVSSIMHRFGFRILRYMDDWLVLGSSLQEIKQARDFLLGLCSELGVQVNLAKSSLTPSQVFDYLGMTLHSSPLRAFPTPARVAKVLSLVEEFSSSREQPLSLWRSFLGVMSSLSTLIPCSRLRMRVLQHRLLVAGPQSSAIVLISWDDSCLQDLRWWSVPCHIEVGVDLSLPHPELLLYTDASDSGWSASLGDAQLSGLWSRDASTFSINHRELLAGFPPSFPRPCGVSFHGQHDSAFIPPQGRGYTVFDPQLRGPGCSSPLQSQRIASAPPVCPWPPQRPFGLPQPRLSGTGVRMDSFHGGLSGAVPPLAGHGGCIRYISQPSAPGPLLPDGGSPGCGHRCNAPVLGSSPSLRLPTVRVHPALPHQGSPIPQSGGDSGGSVLAAPSMVPGSLGAPGGGACPSTSVQGPVPATLPPLPSEPPSVRSDWVSHCQRTVRHFGFSS